MEQRRPPTPQDGSQLDNANMTQCIVINEKQLTGTNLVLVFRLHETAASNSNSRLCAHAAWKSYAPDMNSYVPPPPKKKSLAGSISPKFDATCDKQNDVQYDFAALVHGVHILSYIPDEKYNRSVIVHNINS